MRIGALLFRDVGDGGVHPRAGEQGRVAEPQLN
jgi:hypothetical protein